MWLRKGVILEKASKQKDQGALYNEEAWRPQHRRRFSTRVRIPNSKMDVLSGFYPRRRSNGVSSYCCCTLEVLSVRHKARNFLLRLLPQVRIQRLTNNVRIMQVVLEAVIRKPLFEVCCRAERNIGVLNFSHNYFLLCCSLSLYLYRATSGCRSLVISLGK
jgi:hypothetical protein